MFSRSRHDRRRFERIPVSISIVGHIDDRPYTCRARVLSEDAMIVEGLGPEIAAGSFIQLNLFIPGSPGPVWAVAESAPLSDGTLQLLTFCILPDSDRAALRAFVARRIRPREAERIRLGDVEIVRPNAVAPTHAAALSLTPTETQKAR